MITPDHVRLLARYNRWQNESLYGAADTLSDDERKAGRGAFFGSIHGTLSHLVFGDQAWMHRFTGEDAFRPIAGSIQESATAIPDWGQLKTIRTDLDQRIVTWADQLAPEGLTGDLVWFSGALGKKMSRPRWILVTHMFNHQTHHRGQVHCLLTQLGRKPAATDIPFMPS
jgi:uncharacterized damage-inducible protein DinB